MSSQNKKNEFDRRSILKSVLFGTGLSYSGMLSSFLGSMSTSMIQKAYAQAAGDDAAFQDLKLISIVLKNGAPRYYWDLPLKPNDSDTLISNPMCISQIDANGNGIYKTTKINGINMPSIWDAKIPTIGGSADMKLLAKNMLTIRGIDLQIDSHEIDRYRQMAPIAGGISLSGLVADVAKSPIPAIGRNGGGTFYKGEKGVAYLEMNDGADPFSKVLNPFSKEGEMLSLNNGKVEEAIDLALARMLAAAPDKNKFLPSTYSARYNAKKMMLREFSNLASQYTTLRNKYTSLMNRVFGAHLSGNESLRLEGVDNRVIAGNQSGNQRLTETLWYAGADLRTLTNSATAIASLAEGLAIAEFMIINGLSSSVNIAVDDIARGAYDSAINLNNQTYTSNGSVGLAVDAHFTGAHSALITFSRYFRALSACIYEFNQVLKSKKLATGGNLFDQSVVTVTSDFNRLPRIDGTGADHGWQGSNYTLFSGAIDDLLVCGNVATDDTGKRGTWGKGAPVEFLGGREAIIGNAASTVADILEIKTPMPNDKSFVKKVKGKVQLVNTTVKNVA